MQKKYCILFCVILIVFLCACGDSTSRSAYKEATSLFKTGDYQAAAAKFAECGEYKDSQEMLLESKYQYGLSLFESSDYFGAKEEFSLLGNYKDSADMMLESDYQRALNLMQEENYTVAANVLEKLDDYKDSLTLSKECSYLIALNYLQKGDYSTANRIFTKLGDYKDSDDLANEALYLTAQDLLNRGEYTKAYGILSEIPEYKDVSSYLSRFFTENRLVTLTISKTDNLGTKSTYSEKYVYDGHGNLITRSVNQGKALAGTSSFIHAWADQPYSPVLATTERYEYDSDGKLEKITGLNWNTPNYIVTFDYNERNQIVSETITTGNDQGVMYLSYNNDDMLTLVQADNSHGFSITYSYDPKGNVLNVYNSVNLGYSFSHNYTYENDRVIQDSVWTNFGNNYTDVFYYNSSGDIEKIERKYDDKNSLDEVIEFLYEKFAFYI